MKRTAGFKPASSLNNETCAESALLQLLCLAMQTKNKFQEQVYIISAISHQATALTKERES